MKKWLTIILSSVSLSMTLGAQSLNLLEKQLIVFRSDTVLFLTKPQAVAQANFNLSAFQLHERFKAALEREEGVMDLYEESARNLNIQERLNKTLTEDIAVREEELKAVQKFHKKEKRKKFIQNTGLGIVIGVVGTLLLTN